MDLELCDLEVDDNAYSHKEGFGSLSAEMRALIQRDHSFHASASPSFSEDDADSTESFPDHNEWEPAKRERRMSYSEATDWQPEKRERRMSFDVYSLGAIPNTTDISTDTDQTPANSSRGCATAIINNRKIRVRVSFVGKPAENECNGSPLYTGSESMYHADPDSDSGVDSVERKIGIYSPEQRRARILKFHAKRKRRVWNKKIKYNCRKKLADDRPRIKGRFVRSDGDGEDGVDYEHEGEEGEFEYEHSTSDDDGTLSSARAFYGDSMLAAVAN